MQTANISLSEETWTLIDLYREGTGLGRSAAIEVLVGCALTQGLVALRSSGPEAGAPDGGEEATGSSTPASSGGSSEHSPDV